MDDKIVDKFNEFIKNWCGDSYPHLIDSDDNDGEFFRNELKELQSQLAKAEEILKAYKRTYSYICLPSEQNTCGCLGCRIIRYFAEKEEEKLK